MNKKITWKTQGTCSQAIDVEVDENGTVVIIKNGIRYTILGEKL